MTYVCFVDENICQREFCDRCFSFLTYHGFKKRKHSRAAQSMMYKQCGPKYWCLKTVKPFW